MGVGSEGGCGGGGGRRLWLPSELVRAHFGRLGPWQRQQEARRPSEGGVAVLIFFFYYVLLLLFLFGFFCCFLLYFVVVASFFFATAPLLTEPAPTPSATRPQHRTLSWEHGYSRLSESSVFPNKGPGEWWVGQRRAPLVVGVRCWRLAHYWFSTANSADLAAGDCVCVCVCVCDVTSASMNVPEESRRGEGLCCAS